MDSNDVSEVFLCWCVMKTQNLSTSLVEGRLIDGYYLKDFAALATHTTEPASTGPSVIFHDLSPASVFYVMREFWKINSMCKLRMIARSR